MLTQALSNLESAVVEETFRKFLEAKNIDRAKGTAQLCVLLYQEWKKEGKREVSLKEDTLSIKRRSLFYYLENLRTLDLAECSFKSEKASRFLIAKLSLNFFDVLDGSAQTEQKNAQKKGSDRPANEYSLSEDHVIDEVKKEYVDDLEFIINEDKEDTKYLVSPNSPSLYSTILYSKESVNSAQTERETELDSTPLHTTDSREEKSFYSIFKKIVYDNHACKGNTPFYEHFFKKDHDHFIHHNFKNIESFESYCEDIAANDFLMGRTKQPFKFRKGYFFSEPVIGQWKNKVGYFKSFTFNTNDPAVEYSKYQKKERATEANYERIPDSVAEDYANKQDVYSFDGWFKKELYSLFKENDRMAEYISWFVDKDITFKVETIPFMYDGERLEEEFLHIEAHPFRRDNVQRRFYTELEKAFERYFETYCNRKPYRNKGLDVTKIKKA